MKLNTAFIAAALLTSVIAAPLASAKPVNVAKPTSTTDLRS